MSNASLKDQLQAVASQLSETLIKSQTPQSSKHQANLVSKPAAISKVVKRPDIAKTAVVSKPKPKWLMYVQYGVELLRTYFPQTFKNASEVKPLKKGIKQDLIKALSALDNVATDDKACMVKSLAYYVNTVSYHKSVIEGAIRIDLEGHPAGMVLPEEAQYSIERFEAKQKAKQAKLVGSKLPVQEKVEAV